MAIAVETIETPSLGDRSYMVHDRAVALVVDPQRDIDRVLDLASGLGVRVTDVVETHVHNDYVTGGLALAQATGAAYHLPSGADADFAHDAVRDGRRWRVGSFTVEAVRTPGHTHHHLSYVVADGDGPVAAFTGGSMLYGTVGRTDLVGDEATLGLTRDQYRSVRRLAIELSDPVSVHPTHGFGSFCSSGASADRSESTIGLEKADNLALIIDDEDRFVEELLGGLSAHPRYYAHVAPLNRLGPSAADLSPPPVVEPDEIARRIAGGEWVVDLRERDAFASDHVVGTVNVGLGDSFATYLGWTIPWGTPVTLLGVSNDEVADAQRMLARIGIDRPAGAAVGGPARWGAGLARGAYRTASFAELRDTGDDAIVLDVRRSDEWRRGHLRGATHIPFDQLAERVGEIPPGEVWVHCASGYRAALSASMLVRAGRRDVVLIDDEWDDVRHVSGLERTAG